MEGNSSIQMTSSEVANLWKVYEMETLNVCMIQHFLSTLEDPEIISLTEEKLSLKEDRIKQLQEIFQKEKFPIPMGMTKDDINKSAPKLFTDTFIIQYLHYMARIGIETYGLAVSCCPRYDLRDFFIKGLHSFSHIQNKIMDLLLEKGIYVRSPYVPYPDKVDFVKEQGFITGWLGERRPLHTVQITHLYLNIQRNAIGQQLMSAFSQCARDKDVKKYMLRGKHLSMKFMEIFSSLLKEDDLIPPTFGGIGITTSTVPPFSDKLMLTLVANLNAYGMSLYGLSLSESTRRDLFAQYTRIMAEVGQFAEDGVNLLIKHGYFEEPPKAPDRKEIAQT
ncbi:DUF3231 family protein [Ammoniphilus sp. CFH 90114]|uniref:DUF3231 family protein n=1 Tax=Ammoniphilus sp. CFH 90114 TaxID=2493665 RepID=UPI00100E3294|nr:DUF3231 family protein [Ammoniphilus sp. CFH 90114]RXT07109.1 DUF3231 family protein [Ammoniphilus sp. CFH 90114]